MSMILFTWELGAGLGHLMHILGPAEALARRGHRVHVALRHLTGGTGELFGRTGVFFHQAPFKSRGPLPYPRTAGFAHLLANIGFGDKHELFLLASAWRRLIESVAPDLIFFEHSPTALLASRGMSGVKRVLMGPGFFCPPDTCPLVSFDTPGRGAADGAKLIDDEQRVLALANRLLTHWSLPTLQRLGQLYAQVDDTFLMTFGEMDHFGEHRPAGAIYDGPVNGTGGIPPAWPEGDGPRVYAYLKDFPALPELLSAMIERNCRTIVFADGVSPDVRRRFPSPLLRFENQRLDLSRVGAECDVAIHNANHGTLCQLLLSGQPMLQIPITLEQKVLARAVDRLGASETAPARGEAAGDVIRAKLDALLADVKYADAAARFAAKYASFDPAKQIDRMIDRVEELMAGRETAAAPRSAVFAG